MEFRNLLEKIGKAEVQQFSGTNWCPSELVDVGLDILENMSVREFPEYAKSVI